MARTCSLVLLISLALGCGGRTMPPPIKPEPAVLRTAEGKQLAAKLLEILAKKDAEGVKSMKKTVHDKLAQSLQKGGPLMDNDFTVLLGPLNLAEDGGDFDNAEANLRGVLERTANTPPEKAPK